VIEEPTLEVLELLGDGDRLPRLAGTPIGPTSQEHAQRLETSEAPGINTVVDGSAHVWAAARGANVVDVDGNRLVDLTAGFGAASIGHAHPAVVSAVRKQSELLLHGLGDVSAHPTRIELAQRLKSWLPIDDARIYFAVSGADAVEVALKTALLSTGRSGVLAFDPSYHGLTLGPLSVSSRAHFREPFRAMLRPGVRQLPFGADFDAITEVLAGGEIGAVIFEPIVGREGVILPPAGWLVELCDAARSAGALTIADEILTGFGRTGARFAVEAEAAQPDILLCGKGLAGGLPIGVVAARRDVMEGWRAPGEARHTGTFVAHPLACAAALAVLDVLDRGQWVERAETLGRSVRTRTERWAERFADCVEVRGRGLLWGVECTGADEAARLSSVLMEQGFIALAGGADGSVLELTPPLTIAERQLDAAFDALETALGDGGG